MILTKNTLRKTKSLFFYRQVSEQVGALTFAHEIGHSFGAVHDPVECAGNEEDGTYLMYKSGSLGLK